MLGQSFGGFTSMTYLSIAPEGLREAFITGGLSPIGRPVDDIYGATYRRAIDSATGATSSATPRTARGSATILRRLEAEDVRLPTGDRLTARRFRQLGMWLGDSAGFELLHHVVELPFGSPAFLHDVEAAVALRAQPDLRDAPRVVVRRRRGDALVGAAAAARRGRGRGRLFTAEHVFPWMWDDYAGLRPSATAAELLAEHPWPRLYDADRLRAQRGPGRGDDLRQRPVRRARVRRGDGGGHPRPAAVGDRRVRAQRPAGRRRARPRPADRPGARPRLTGHPLGDRRRPVAYSGHGFLHGQRAGRRSGAAAHRRPPVRARQRLGRGRSHEPRTRTRTSSATRGTSTASGSWA